MIDSLQNNGKHTNFSVTEDQYDNHKEVVKKRKKIKGYEERLENLDKELDELKEEIEK